MTKTKDVAGNAPATEKKLGGVTGKGFMPGQSGNPRGDKMDPALRALLRLDTQPRYERLKKLSLALEEQGDLKGASTIELALLKKQIPDLSAVEVTGAEGGPIQTQSIDATKLTKEELLALRAMQAKSAK